MSEIEVNKISGVSEGAVRFPVYSSAPTGSEFGQIYFDSTDKKFKYYSGNQWTPITGNTTQPGLGHYYPDHFTKLLVQSDHPNNSTTFYDASQHNNMVYPSGSLKHVTSQKKIGDSSIYFDGTSDDYLDISNHDQCPQALRLQACPYWTIDFWIYFDTLPSDNKRVMEHYDHAGVFQNQWGMGLSSVGSNDGIGFVSHRSGTRTANYSMTVGWAVDTWFHIAFSRNKDTIIGFVNGVEKTLTASTAIAADTRLTVNFTQNFFLGRGKYSDRNLHHAYLDEVRISIGVVRWTSDFTVY